ncbi:ABC transporter substrate-binding protein [Corynebacterium epidermidicanis]|uniref:ABC-type Fe3+-hydroxamate transport system, periplasmic component n=1 Tax=Corynebacterium epidermidicanis TaxID=1050174 RepID=A0A0G3GNX9_9CORY|nr:ABC transporter substrate-binding protein [Corynebacterium epidermidicanis]AKK02936.1 ABC-type Fe3+-hydroxamate transport system, periplasmic component [Corynebacterium epidermidicanis]
MKKFSALLAVVCLTLTGCGAKGASKSAESAVGVAVDNCGENKTLPRTNKLWAYDGSIIAISLAAGARDNLQYVSGIARDRDVLESKYGSLDSIEEATTQAPSLEELVARKPDVYFAGWGYGLGEASGVTPDVLAKHGIDTYLLSETCKQANGNRGVFDPWEAANTDIRNIAAIAGDSATAEETIADIDRRRAALESAPKVAQAPKVFLFDSAKDTIFTSGKFGGPQAIFESAGVGSATADIADTWTAVSWEKLAAAAPDAIAFVDYPGQDFSTKVELLKNNPATKDLVAVQENRFINLPYAMWTSGPLNVDAAEHVRANMEGFGFLPKSDIAPQLTLPATLAGQEYGVSGRR